MIPSTSSLRSLTVSFSRAVSTSRPSYTRSFASVLSSVPTTAKTAPKVTPENPQNGQLRPQLNISVDPNHGLYAFFRKKEVDGVVKYDTVEAPEPMTTSRAWTAAELRRKSFKDLHTLWYVLVRERNLLATQREEGRRLQINPSRLLLAQKAFRVRKSMARIKYVINERRMAYEDAVKILAEKQTTPVEGTVVPAIKGADAAAALKEAPKKEHVKAANLAAAGLFETAEVEIQSESPEKRS
ncbi:MRP-L47-domain-containing protein [Cristinia sonorae]|uniref:Large ribosomal subunit protein uL29m n=1 Tax=Cristinia sonorae TaxID=1940300 RepID=A0A8K0XSY9_9AGAR|nr:MRP-L47-domain-containing protein [Cristinia sonorae]